MRAKATKAVAAQQMLRRAEELFAQAGGEIVQDKVARLRFPDPAPSGRVPLTAEGLSKSYGSLEVFTGVDLAIDRGSKVVVLGLNGAGKTTLLRLLSGIEKPDSGRVVPGHGLKIGYYAQEHETLDDTRTIRENMADAAPTLDDTHVRNILGQFLFQGDDVDKPVCVLSGGEKTRLALATLVVSGANVLLLDEPTNNLDPASREEILAALRDYEGAVILVTHDPGAVTALNPQRVLLLPDADEDLWDDSYLDLVTLTRPGEPPARALRTRRSRPHCPKTHTTRPGLENTSPGLVRQLNQRTLEKNSLVRSSCGLSITSAGEPASTITPPSIKRT